MVNASWKVKPWLEVGTNNQIEHYKTESVAEGSDMAVCCCRCFNSIR